MIRFQFGPCLPSFIKSQSDLRKVQSGPELFKLEEHESSWQYKRDYNSHSYQFDYPYQDEEIRRYRRDFEDFIASNQAGRDLQDLVKHGNTHAMKALIFDKLKEARSILTQINSERGLKTHTIEQIKAADKTAANLWNEVQELLTKIASQNYSQDIAIGIFQTQLQESYKRSKIIETLVHQDSQHYNDLRQYDLTYGFKQHLAVLRRQLCKQEDSIHLYVMGWILFFGKFDHQKDEVQAQLLLKRSWALGNTHAEYLLVQAAKRVPSIAPEYVKSIWIEQLEKESSKGEILSQVRLGECYLKGLYTQKEKTIQSLQQAYQGPSTLAAYLLACIYENDGQSSEAQVWFEKASDQGFWLASKQLILSDLAKDSTAPRAYELLMKHASHRNTEAISLLSDKLNELGYSESAHYLQSLGLH